MQACNVWVRVEPHRRCSAEEAESLFWERRTVRGVYRTQHIFACAGLMYRDVHGSCRQAPAGGAYREGERVWVVSDDDGQRTNVFDNYFSQVVFVHQHEPVVLEDVREMSAEYTGAQLTQSRFVIKPRVLV